MESSAAAHAILSSALNKKKRHFHNESAIRKDENVTLAARVICQGGATVRDQ